MPGQERKDFDDRLAELSNWQIEQQKKLKAFQEAQRKLLDLEHQKILNGFNTHNFEQKLNRCSESNSDDVCGREETESSLNVNNVKNRDGIFHLKFPKIRLSEPKTCLFGVQNCSPSIEKSDEFLSESMGDSEERETKKPRKFLKRGEGLARFRMTLDDFKGPPQIYREKKIKTYLNSKPESKGSSRSVKSSKSKLKTSGSCAVKAPVKSAPLPVKIYLPEKRPCNSARTTQGKQVLQDSKKVSQTGAKSPLECLTFRPHDIATEWYNAMKGKEKAVGRGENLSVHESDTDNKKDEKELRIFEILEKKVDDMSFCSTSSFVDKLMEQSLSSTPAKSGPQGTQVALPRMQGPTSLRSQLLDKPEESDAVPWEEGCDGSEGENGGRGGQRPGGEPGGAEGAGERGDCGEGGAGAGGGEVRVGERSDTVNRKVLEGYMRELKELKELVAAEEGREGAGGEEEKGERAREEEMVLKLRRKGLEDNVKQLLNWECPPRRRQAKRVVKKVKTRAKVEKRKGVSKEQSEKVVVSSSLLAERLKELEKEIEIFRKENRNMERLEKECKEERMKLGKERRELQKQMQEERERLEGKMAEEQKKLQKEKAVFEKYCKQVKSQPTRQEREETAKLKKEIEKLTETLTTKEARWGAAQARLRNQIKTLQRENGELKAEVEKYKKLSAKKVSFENERNLNTKIIHVINSELGKLKPVIQSGGGGRNQSLSARAERNVGVKPIRRIRSAPNVKRETEGELCPEASSEAEERGLGSVSTDSGIETNGCRYLRTSQEPKRGKEGASGGQGEKKRCKSPAFGPFGGATTGKKTESSVESAVHDAIFGDIDMTATSMKIAQVKSRLERLSLLGCAEDSSGNPATKMVSLAGDRVGSESYGSESSVEEQEEEEEEEEEEKEGEKEEEEEEGQETNPDVETSFPLRKSFVTKSDSFPSCYPQRILLERKPGENGILEKLFEDGSKEIHYPNGNVKKIFPGSKIVRMTYYNGDIKEMDVAEGSEKYYYAETKTWHTTYKDGLEVLEFPNGQTERRHADGSTEISFPNGCVRYCDSSGRDEWRFLDGTVIRTNEWGHKILLMANGQKEIHTKEYKRREYPDGTVKMLYSDGTQETRYASGRVRLKDKEGNLVMDSGGIR